VYSAERGHECEKDKKPPPRQCPVCEEVLEGMADLQINEHVEHHFRRECPFCYK
jgi:hypothetical protein